jgi:hypothetical protein
VQGVNYLVDIPNKSLEADYLPKGGFMDNGTSSQIGLQIARHFSNQERKYDFWVRGRVGVNTSRRYNEAGTYWFWKNQDEKEYYTITKKQTKEFHNFETNIAVGLSHHIWNGISVFVEPAFNCQFYTHNYRVNQQQSLIKGFLVLRYGVNFSL